MNKWQYFEIQHKGALRYDLLTINDSEHFFKFRNLSNYFYTVYLNERTQKEINLFYKNYRELYQSLEQEFINDGKSYQNIVKLVFFYALQELEDQIDSNSDIRQLLRDRPFNIIAETYFDTKWNLSENMNYELKKLFEIEFFDKDS